MSAGVIPQNKRKYVRAVGPRLRILLTIVFGLVALLGANSAHVLAPVLAVWLYLLHRLAGPRIKWRVGLGWAGAVGVLVIAMVLLHAQDPRKWNVAGPKEGEKYYYPSLARTASGNFIPA